MTVFKDLKDVGLLCVCARAVFFAAQFGLFVFLTLSRLKGVSTGLYDDSGRFVVSDDELFVPQWDSTHFLFISKYGYTHESNVAFFSGAISNVIKWAGAGWLGQCIQWIWWYLGAFGVHTFAVLLSPAFNVSSREKARNLAMTATNIYCFCPASVFMVACSGWYSETFYSCCMVWGLVFMLAAQRTLDSGYTGMLTAAYAVLATQCLMYGTMTRSVSVFFLVWLGVSMLCFRKILYLLCCVFWGLSIVLQMCNAHIPSLQQNTPSIARFFDVLAEYGRVQRKHWGVGFGKRLQFKEIPNFALALPAVVCVCALARAVAHREFALRQHLPFWLHSACLCAVVLSTAHPQIMTRVLCSAAPYWFTAAAWYVNEGRSSRFRWWGTIWCVVFQVFGVCMHSVGLPWT